MAMSSASMLRSVFRSSALVSGWAQPPSMTVSYVPLPRSRWAPYGTGISIDNIRERVLKVVKAHEEVKEPDAVTTATNFRQDLGLDSLAHAELVMQMEDEFHVEITEENMADMKTVDDVISFFIAHPSAK